MHRLARIASHILLVASLPAVAAPDDNDGFKAKVRAAVENEVRERQQSPPQDSPAQVISEHVAASSSSSSNSRRNRRDDYRYDPIYCGSFGDCPYGTRGPPTFDELRQFYRHYPDSALWDICLGRRPANFAYGSQGACMMITSPNPWRPVDVPHYLEHDPLAPIDESDYLAVAAAMGISPGEGAILEVAQVNTALPETQLPPCKSVNETLNRKRPRLCAVDRRSPRT